MKSSFKRTIILLSIASTAMCVLPLMSTRLSSGDGFTDIICIHGYNLMEFSALGCVPLFAGLLILVILFGSQTKVVKELELLLLFTGNIICYVHSFNAAKAWIYSIKESVVLYYPGKLLFPLGFIIVLVSAIIYSLHTAVLNECERIRN